MRTDIKRVLMVSYFFAPSPAVGATRAVKFYEYLPHFEWEPHVLTIHPAVSRSNRELPRVIRTNYWSPWKWLERRRAQSTQSDHNPRGSAVTLCQVALKSRRRQKIYVLLRHILPMSSVRMPDATLGWYPFAVKAGLALLGARKFDAIWSSTGPPINHLLAAKLHQRTGIPWVADFRDLWSLNYVESRLSLFQAIEERLERRILSQASRITTISEGLSKMLSDFYNREVDVVYNGYDGNLHQVTQAPAEQHFTIRYTGALYPELANVQAFLQALLQVREQEPEFAPCVQFVGPGLSWLVQIVKDYGLSDVVECLLPVPRERALDLQQRSTALLLFDRDSTKQLGWMPVKMFEYMRTGRPILQVGSKQSESAIAIAKSRAGVTVEESEEIRETLLSWWNKFQQTGTVAWSTDIKQVSQYSRQAQTRRLAQILDNCM